MSESQHLVHLVLLGEAFDGLDGAAVFVWNEERRYVAVNDEADRTASNQVAAALRGRGIPTEVAPSAAKFGKQIKHADRRGIPWVWFLGEDGHSVKDLRTGDQVAADPAAWSPPAQDLRPTISEHEETPK